MLRAAALFEYVKKNVTYVPDPSHMSEGEMVDGDYVAPPVETLDARGGDCDDQAVLIASLFSAVGIENRMRLISNTDNEVAPFGRVPYRSLAYGSIHRRPGRVLRLWGARYWTKNLHPFH